MKTRTVIFFIFLNVFSASINAKDIYCPTLPITVEFGQTIEEEWLIWPQNIDNNLFNRIYYKFFKKTNVIDFWGGYITGVVEDSKNSEKTYIACCTLMQKNKRRICAYKEVNFSGCNQIVKYGQKDKFVCS